MTCPRCQGFVVEVHEETYCVNCGWRKIEPWAPAYADRVDAEPWCSHKWTPGTSADRAARRKVMKLAWKRRKRREAKLKGVTT